MRCFFKAMREYADFHARSGRREFWLFFVGWALFGALSVWLDRSTGSYNFKSGIAVFESFWFFGFLLPWMAASVRRLHDTGRSGWWLAAFLPGLVYLYAVFMPDAQDVLLPWWPAAALSWAAYLALMALPGDDGPNAYGKPERAWC